MVRSTSIEAYHDLINSDELGKKQKIVLQALIVANLKNGAVSAAELFNEQLKGKNLVFSNVRARLSELRDMGVIEERDKRACAYTTRKVITWHFTGAKPERVNRIPKSLKKELIKERFNLMYAELRGHNKLREDLKALWRMVREL